MTAPAEALEVIAEPLAAQPRRKRRIWLLIILPIVLLLVAAATTVIVKVSTENAIGYLNDDSYVSGSGAVLHDDPFSGSWAEVTYAPGGKVSLGMTIGNTSDAQTITIRSVTFDQVGTGTQSAFSAATLSVDFGLDGGSSNLQPFHPFRIPPGRLAYIQWTLTMCPTGTIEKDRNRQFSTMEINYTYFGFDKHATVPLGTPLQVDNAGNGCV
jgi:hypothetical protein